jgi:hypothetical protein
MSQLIIVTPSAPAAELPITNFAEIPGLKATILNGSGWIKLSATLNLYDSTAASKNAFLRLTRDGIPINDSERLVRVQTSYYLSATLLAAIRPGAGQHTYAVEGMGSAAGIQIVNTQASFIIEEPGY